jgi:hypothetical protein
MHSSFYVTALGRSEGRTHQGAPRHLQESREAKAEELFGKAGEGKSAAADIYAGIP